MSAAKHQAVLHVGLSFANLGLFDSSDKSNKLKWQRQIYLPQEPLSTSLKKVWAEHGAPSQIFVSSQFVEKILDAKLGGSVAQIVTRGFETWPVLRQPVWPERFDINSVRAAPLASQELIFGLSERVSADGQVLQPLKMEELEFINEKLKLMSVKRVCVNLLFSRLYPDHQERVAKYFQEQGFEVFAFPRGADSVDEMPAWRKNIINACLSGVFSEHIDDIKNSLPEGGELFFLGSQGEKFLTDKNNIVSGLFAWSGALRSQFSSQADHVLYLGLENWSLLHNQEQNEFWASQWGRIEVRTPKQFRLKTQPTQELVPGFWGGINFSHEELSFEPGPMSFGRALKPTLYDLMQILFSFSLSQNNSQGEKRLKDHLSAMIKNIPELRDLGTEKMAKMFVQQAALQVVTEAQFKSFVSGKKSKTLVTGFFAPLLYPLLKESWVSGELVLDSQASDCELLSTWNLSQNAGLQ